MHQLGIESVASAKNRRGCIGEMQYIILFNLNQPILGKAASVWIYGASDGTIIQLNGLISTSLIASVNG
jgi:hypothetical protein